MFTVKESIRLDTSPDVLWAYITESEKLLLWVTEFREHTWLDMGPPTVGTRFYVEKEIRGQVQRYEGRVRRWEENRCYSFECEAPGFSFMEGEWEIIPEGQGCRFEMRETINVLNANPIIDWLFIRPNATRNIRGFLANLKSLVDGRQNNRNN